MPPVVVGAVMAASAIAGGVAGAIERSNASDEAKALMQARLDELNAVGQPPDTSIALVLQEFKQQGIITPELEKEILQETSKVAQLKEDPGVRDAQVKALQFLQNRSETGLGPEERSAFNLLRKEVAKDTEGKRQQILQNMAAKGMSGSGAELAAQLSASQAGDEAAAAAGDRIAASAAQNALQAMAQVGQLGGQIRGQDFDVARTKAGAEDEMNRFNTQAQIARQTRNIAAQNEAQARNLQEKQRMSDMNVQQANQEAARQMAAKESVWRNKLALAGAKGDVYSSQANQRLKEGEANAAGWQQMGQGVAQGAAAMGGGGMAGGMTGKTATPTQSLGVDTNLTNQSDTFSQSMYDKYPWLKK